MNVFLVLLALALPGFAMEAVAAPCPPELSAAVEDHRKMLATSQALVRASTPENPLGLELTQAFDISTHDCHRMPGQVYREYGEGACELDAGGKSAVIRYPYITFFRKAASQEALFALPWTEGTDGILQVVFELSNKGWVPAGTREMLNLSVPPKHKGPPIPEVPGK
jgi:hypothetical protein